MSFLVAFINRQFISKPPVPTVSYKGRTVIVTGSNVGLGREACRKMVELGASQIIMACRNVEKGKAAAKDIREATLCSSDMLQVWELDMSSYASVLAFADRVKAELPRVDALVGNAGIQTVKFEITENDEETITTNVVSLALLGFLIYPILRETAVAHQTQTHFTVTASELYEIAKFKERNATAGKIFAELSDKSKANMRDRYPTSKLLGMMVVKQMAAMSPLDSGRVIINCVAPGLCDSELHRENESFIGRFLVNGLARPTEVGARTLVYGASAGAESHGQYLPDCKITPTVGLLKGKGGAELQNRVWSELKEKLEKIRPGVTFLL